MSPEAVLPPLMAESAGADMSGLGDGMADGLAPEEVEGRAKAHSVAARIINGSGREAAEGVRSEAKRQGPRSVAAQALTEWREQEVDGGIRSVVDQEWRWPTDHAAAQARSTSGAWGWGSWSLVGVQWELELRQPARWVR